ncbi:MAG TPA: hypothetical protein VN026_07595 [Bacteroidia bacterium]|nr:hypothetical protein [Bacteroidia bacterium]
MDNLTYKVGSVFLYDYYYLDQFNKKWKFSFNGLKINSDLILYELESKSDSLIDKIKIIVDDNTKDFLNFDSTYSQTVISYYYLNRKGDQIDTTCEIFKKNHPKFEQSCGDVHQMFLIGWACEPA